MSKYLIFDSPFESPLAENIGILVRAKKDKQILGRIEYYPRWKQFIFAPTAGTAWSWDCLADIEAKLKELNSKESQNE